MRLVLLAALVAYCACQCYNANLSEYHNSCGFYGNETIGFLNGTVVVESVPSFEITIVSNYSQSCYFGLGACSSQNVLGGNTGLGCNAPYCTLSFSVAPSQYYSFQLENVYSSTYFTPLIVNITIRTEDGNFHYFNTSKPSSNCTYPYPSSKYSFNSTIIGIQVSGNYFFIEGFTFCKSSSPPPPTCSPQLYMFGGGNSCNQFRENQCVQCSTNFGQSYYYSANCTTVGTSCFCTSYLHSGYNCTGNQLAQPVLNDTCSQLTSFYPQSGSVCMPVYSVAPSHTIVVYNATYVPASCSTISENSCYRCDEYGQTYYFKPTCTSPTQCHVTQSIYSDCSSPVVTAPMPNADCYELSNLYGSSGAFGCAFGFYTANQVFNKTVTVSTTSTTQ